MNDKNRERYAKRAWRKSASIREYFRLMRMYDARSAQKERGKYGD